MSETKFRNDVLPTIFDKILRGEIPASVVYEDEFVLAFKDITPQAPVHILVIPKKRAANLSEAASWSSDSLGIFFGRVAKVAIEVGLDRNGYRVVLNTGRDAGQTVEYIHAHILGGEQLGRFGTEV